jgi:hypothetical protein
MKSARYTDGQIAFALRGSHRTFNLVTIGGLA